MLILDPERATALRAAGLRTAHDLLRLGDAGEPRRFVGFVDLPIADGPTRYHLKRYRYAGWREARGLLGRGTLWGMPPEIREYRALARLRTGSVPAVRPVAACAIWEGRRLAAHALLTEAIGEASDLDARLRDPRDPLTRSFAARRDLAVRLGQALRKMHALPFVHRDCHARNVLVRVDGARTSLWFLDCRRGGARARGGALGDLATLDRDLRGRLTRGERRAALAAYLDGRDAKDLVRRLAARRDALPPPRR